MSEFTVSTRYANSFLGLAGEKYDLEKISSEIKLVYDTFEASKDLQRILKNPVIKSEKKIEILENIFASKISSKSLNFLKFILKKNREELLFDVTKRFLELNDEKLGIVDATVTSAVELTDVHKNGIKVKLENYTGKTIRTKFVVNPDIIGGFLVRIGDTVLDASISHQLYTLKNKFKFASISLN